MSELLPTTFIVLLVSVLAGVGDEIVTLPSAVVVPSPLTTSVDSHLTASLIISLTFTANVPDFFTTSPLENVLIP